MHSRNNVFDNVHGVGTITSLNPKVEVTFPDGEVRYYNRKGECEDGNSGITAEVLGDVNTYNVNMYVQVRVKIGGIRARSQQEAMEIADNATERVLSQMFPDQTTGRDPLDYDEITIESGGYAEEISGYVVDEADDPEYRKTEHYNADHEVEGPELTFLDALRGR